MTYTFYMHEGDVTLTIQNMFVLLGLPIDGEPLTGCADVDIYDYCGEYLGQLPEAHHVVKNRLLLRWLQETFDLCHLRD